MEIYTRTVGSFLEHMRLIEYVAHVQGHKNSDGESAPWVIKSHDDGHIISSHKTQAEAKAHLQQMHIFKK